jgi:hypothetical protein
MTRTVKLTPREPTAEIRDALGVEQGHHASDADVTEYRSAHDAALEDATKALEQLVDEVVTVRENGVDLKHLFEALDRLRATPEGDALIRQAEQDNT